MCVLSLSLYIYIYIYIYTLIVMVLIRGTSLCPWTLSFPGHLAVAPACCGGASAWQGITLIVLCYNNYIVKYHYISCYNTLHNYIRRSTGRHPASPSLYPLPNDPCSGGAQATAQALGRQGNRSRHRNAHTSATPSTEPSMIGGKGRTESVA